MPIMASHGRTDARGTARLLATMALASLDRQKRDTAQEVALNNMYRLLQSFRTDVFFGEEESLGSPEGTSEKLTLRPPEERNVRQVRTALEQATTAAFEGQPKDEALEVIESVLRWVAYPSKAAQPSKTDRTRTTTFFRELVERL